LKRKQTLEAITMDDLDLLKRFREDVPVLDAEELAVARVTLANQIGLTEPSPSSPGPRKLRRRVALAAVLAGVLAAGVVVSSILGGPGIDPAAASALRHVAKVAANQPKIAPPAPGQYVYTKSEQTQYVTDVPGHGLTNFLYGVPEIRQAWIGIDGSGRLEQTLGNITFPSPADRAAWVAAGSPDLQGAADRGDHTYAQGGLSYLDLSSLPTDPAKLQTLVEQRVIEGGPSGDWETFAILGDMLRETHASPDLRAAIYDIAANLPGVEFVGKTTDASGRPGIGVAYTSSGTKDELIFDPKTSALLGETSVIVDPSQLGDPGMGPLGPVGSVLYATVYLDSSVVDSTQAVPGTS
jgi:hypothetical protein